MKINQVRSRCEKEVGKLLIGAGLSFNEISDLPANSIRHAQRGDVPGMRVTQLAPDLCDQFLNYPITRDLLCLRAGHHQALPTHYLPRPDGSRDCIFIYVVSGRGWVDLHGKTWTLEPRTGFVIPRDVPHTYGADPDDPWSTYWTHFQGGQADDYTNLIMADDGNPVIHLPRNEEIVASLEQLLQYMNQVHTYLAMIAASGALSQLLSLIPLRSRAAELRAREAEEHLEQSIKFMHRNLTRRLSLRELAAVAGMSPNHYTTIFSSGHGHPPIDYFNRLKVQRACELLSTTSLRISEVGEYLGFADPYYFSRLFKKIMGVSPRNYR